MPRLLKRLRLRLRATVSAQQDCDRRAELDRHLRLLGLRPSDNLARSQTSLQTLSRKGILSMRDPAAR